jgi:hypothetical protein
MLKEDKDKPVDMIVDDVEMRADRYLYWTAGEESPDRELVEEGNMKSAFMAIHRNAEVTKDWLKETGCVFEDGKIVTPAQQEAKAAESGGDAEPKAIDDMTVPELKAFLTEKSVEFKADAVKADLVELAKAAESGGER